MLFDPTAPTGTPGDQPGEKVKLSLMANPVSPSPSTPASSCGVWWDGLYHARSMKWWNPVANTIPVETEIKDGAICTITADVNNDDKINMDDRKTSNVPGLEVQSHQMKVNNDDDDKNGVVDKDDRPANFNVVQNRSSQSTGQNIILVDGEDDLAEAKMFVWIDSLTPLKDGEKIVIDIYAHGSGFLEMWTDHNKGKHLHYGTPGIPAGRMEYQRTLDTLTAEHTSYQKSVWLEATGFGEGQILVTADVMRIDPVTSQMVSRIVTKRNSANFEAQQSQWQVTRAGQPTATATSGHGDTIFNLALDIGLTASEFKKWLTISGATVRILDGRYIPAADLTPSHKLYGGQDFQIPNTIYMAWFGEMGDPSDQDFYDGKAYMNWYQNKEDLKSLGFRLLYFDNDDFDTDFNAKGSFITRIEELSNSKSLHGMYMMGHGSSDSIGSKGWSPILQSVTVIGPLWSILYGSNVSGNFYFGSDPNTWTIGSALKYHLGALIIHACESNGSNAQFLVSKNGIFHGETGTYIPFDPLNLPGRIARFWGDQNGKYGGKQKTNPFDK